ncbi:MAG TPA: hypothetical protein VKA44_01565 [Gemmatimonadota bacterium]|nr:hypothetical protein [Gemmatimonadota bacterium]
MKSLLGMRSSLIRPRLGLTVAACAVAAGAWTSAATAPAPVPDAVPEHASSCPSLASVKSFQGLVGPSYSDVAAASSQAYGGQITISVEQGAALQVDLPARHSGPAFDVTIFFGKVTSAQAVNSRQSIDRPLKGSIAGTELGTFQSAFLLISPSLCKYQVMASYSTETQFTGDAGARPGTTVTVTAVSPREDIPPTLVLANSAEIPVYENCGSGPTDIPRPTGCYSFGGGWKTDFETYKLCHSTIPDASCASSERSMGTARISWSLHPTY